VDIREIDPADTETLRRHWEIGKAADDASRPYDFTQPWETFRLASAIRRDDLEVVLLGAFVDGVMWGAARLELRLLDNTHAALSAYHVHPHRQRQGIGRALAQASFDLAIARGRSLMVTETYAPVDDASAGLLFAEALGFRTALVDGMKVVDLPATEHLWEELEAKAAPEHSDYRIETWCDGVPDELVPGYCRLSELFNEQAPMGELELRAERWDVDRVRSREQRNRATGRVDQCAGAVAPDGTLVGVTEVGVDVHAPHWGFQSGTIVAPEHRGHRLGLAVKVANHRRLREDFPECRVLVTGNADVNAPMNAVNEALGYREVERCIEMQRAV
jgi:GNAT superfamily N-acetyltransferase/RimJ/RimL family protein N-acetyltransferase